jgi:signal transduction histidine kinase/ActR/RegA family two-component response regulator
MILRQIRKFRWEKEEVEAEMRRAEAEYQGLFDEAKLSEKLRLAYGDLREAREKSLQQERLQALGQMSRGISHDINNALTPIIGYSNLLLHGAGGLSGSALSYVQSIKTAGEKIARSVTCIQDFYRKKETDAAAVVVGLNEVAVELTEEMRTKAQESARAGEREVVFSKELDGGLPQIMGKRSDVQEALRELLANALEAMPLGGKVTVRTGFRVAEVTQLHEAPSDAAFVEVADTGAGMDEDVQRRCLEPFFTTKEQQGAKGLGLARVYGILRRHQGQIEIESAPGQGTVMRLVFPVTHDKTERTSAPVAGAGGIAPLKILCIDDEPAILDVVRLILKGGGHKVETAGDGASGLEKLRVARLFNEPFDVVFTDLGMPGLDGHQVAKMVKEESGGTPVILLTGWGGIMEAEGNKPANIELVLGKPPTVQELGAALRMVAEKTWARN